MGRCVDMMITNRGSIKLGVTQVGVVVTQKINLLLLVGYTWNLFVHLRPLIGNTVHAKYSSFTLK
jgi:hypothetical protein